MDFSNIQDNHTREMLESAYEAIQISGYLDYFKNFTPEENKGFMWTSDRIINMIKDLVETSYNGHSGASLAFTLRQLQDHLKRQSATR